MQYRYEMSITRAEFLRLLPVAVGHAAWRIDGDDVVGDRKKGSDPFFSPPAWRIRMNARPSRPFGPVELPMLGITLVLECASEADCAAFIKRFLLGFQRAGG